MEVITGIVQRATTVLACRHECHACCEALKHQTQPAIFDPSIKEEDHGERRHSGSKEKATHRPGL